MLTSNDLWVSLETVLRDKGASPEWIEYAMPELQVASTQFASQVYGLGHALARTGEQLPNPGDAPPMHVVTEHDGSHWLELVPPESLDQLMVRWGDLDASRTPTPAVETPCGHCAGTGDIDDGDHSCMACGGTGLAT